MKSGLMGGVSSTVSTTHPIAERLRAARGRATETAERRGGTDPLYCTAIGLGALQAAIDYLIDELDMETEIH
jgi:hypothetical protein